ncbi:NFU1 iron-sulfur cluster scaffold [Perkinsus chesapeaki]|uniref:NFU1 iron-sulfur cluster scaffold n=1 Tax=Perkinsus chesapeaki TaxID=330153 RepID=A0A7J6L6H6_PERCH|nr:NFU1 iron-sulfur cluster scaffold [Perkinsus chesapeaki]
MPFSRYVIPSFAVFFGADAHSWMWYLEGDVDEGLARMGYIGLDDDYYTRYVCPLASLEECALDPKHEIELTESSMRPCRATGSPGAPNINDLAIVNAGKKLRILWRNNGHAENGESEGTCIEIRITPYKSDPDWTDFKVLDGCLPYHRDFDTSGYVTIPEDYATGKYTINWMWKFGPFYFGACADVLVNGADGGSPQSEPTTEPTFGGDSSPTTFEVTTVAETDPVVETTPSVETVPGNAASEGSSGKSEYEIYTATSEFCPRAAKELLAVDGVEKVMIGEGFLSIVAPRMVSESEAFSKGQLEAFQRILENAEGLQEDFLGTSELDQAKDLPEQSEVEKRIQALLDDRIRPVIAQDGGDCEFVAFDSETGKVTLALHGSCEGCPQSAKTLKDSIERTLKFYIKEVTSVEPQQVAAEARSPFVHHTHEGARMSDEEKEKLAAETPLFSTFAGATINERMVVGEKAEAVMWGIVDTKIYLGIYLRHAYEQRGRSTFENTQL